MPTTESDEPAAVASDATSTAQLPPPPIDLSASTTSIPPPAPMGATASLADPHATQKTNKNFYLWRSLYDPDLPRVSTLQLGALSPTQTPMVEPHHAASRARRIASARETPLGNGHLLTQQEGVQAVVTMNQPTELLPNWLGTPVTPDDWARAHVAQCFGRTGDFKPPSVETIHHCVDFLHAHIQANQTTYVHCKAGRGRSTVVVLAYLMQHHAMTLDDAHAFVVARRRHISLHPKQRAILTAFAASS